MSKKICVYAICKNERSNIQRWLTSMWEADYIVVLDTGSTDGTYEELCEVDKLNAKFFVYQDIIKPFRFDYARNSALGYVPDDADICVSTDFDETFEPGWAEEIRKVWKDDTVRGLYTYHWSHNPDVTFVYDKIHANHQYHWLRPVHEYLMRIDDKNQDCSYDKFHHVDIPIVLHHWQDITKPRASYLDLLKLRVKEDPDDAYGWWYLGREYVDHNYGYDGVECYERALKIFEDNPNRADIFGMHMASLLNLGHFYRDEGKLEKALGYYHRAMLKSGANREPYLFAAEIYNQLGYYHESIGLVNEALEKVPTRQGHWSEEESSWGSKPYDILSVAYFKIGQLQKAKEAVAKAYEFAPSDERIKKNYEIIMSQEG